MSITLTRVPSRIYPVLAVGILAASFAAIFIRYAQSAGMPSLVIAAGRLTLSALLLTPFALRRHHAEIAALTRPDVLLAAASGLLLAIHFAAWISSLQYTSVLISVVLVDTSPLWVALLEVIFLRVHLRRMVIVGLLIAFGGGLLIALAGGSGATTDAPAPILGGLLALVGAVAIACYLVIGRKLRAKLTLLPYIWLVYGFAAIFLVVLVMVGRLPVTGYSATAYEMIVLLALVPQLIGHTSFNFALRYVSATYVSIASQMEPIGSAIAAFVLFAETPLPLQIWGSGAILLGVIVATLAQESSS